MPNLKYVGLFLIIIIFGILFIPKIIDRVSSNTIVQSNRTQSAEPLSYIVLNGEPKKVPSFDFTNQDNLFISNEDFLGKVYIAEFFFTSCPSICPIMNKNMKRLEDSYGTRNDFGIASFTIDPEHDTPEVLKKYAEDYSVFSQNWHFLTGEKADLYALARRSFFVLKPAEAQNLGDAGSDFIHTNNFVLVDQQLRIRGYYDGTNPKEVSLLQAHIAQLLNEPQ